MTDSNQPTSGFFKSHWVGIFLSSILAGLVASFIYDHSSADWPISRFAPHATPGAVSTAEPSKTLLPLAVPPRTQRLTPQRPSGPTHVKEPSEAVLESPPPEYTLPSSLILPKPTRVVTDDAGVLSVEEVQTLEAKLQELRTARLAEAIIYIAPSLPPGAVLEEVTLRAVNAWGVGRRGINDGLAIFVFVTDRKIRIEVGFGLEAVITDAAAKAIIDDQIAPAFRAHKYGDGLVAAVDELHALLKRPR